MPADSFLRLLQFSDGLFPAGGYAHSFGLETLVQSGRVQNANDVAAFLRAYLESSAAPTDAVAALCAQNHALAGDLNACIRLDHHLDALKSPAELRDASHQMGRQTLRILKELSSKCATVLRFASAVDSEVTPCHHPVVFGLAATANGWEPRETAGAFLYSTSATIVGASLRLLPLGQLAGQRILAEAGSLIAALSETILDKTENDMWSFTPGLEIAAMHHESLDGRLFRS
ncbi:MAG TPA: urease accessory protein UreF [Candidatus Acidoferrales bacterium]|jgi:urease accessory protein|nr:urease accessory protein UreF [Candidatus Acidoferrales bacterium]